MALDRSKPFDHAASDDTRGFVSLVGGGPGDPNLLTLRGKRCLEQADVVLYDYLVNPRILEHCPRAQLICLGRHGHGKITSQEEINRQMVELAAEGKRVVRLKGGDPAVFARAADEIAALRSAQIPFEIVPGITTALASGSYAGIPITHGERASAVALVTGQERPGKSESNLDFAGLAGFPGTLVFYMGITTARDWTSALIAAGKSPDTPAAVVRRCSWPDQETIRCTLGTLADEVERRRLRPPAITIVGEVVAHAIDDNWFARRPLAGTTVLVARPIDQAEPLRKDLEDLGAEVFVQPAIVISPPADWGPVDAALARIAEFDWIVFSSANGVRSLLDRLLKTADLRALQSVKLAAIGPGTADELARYHLRADLIPTEFRAESLATALAPEARGKRFLLARASRGREVLADELRAAGGRVEQIVVYTSTDVTTPDPDVAQRLKDGKIDWCLVTSSAIARSLVSLFGEDLSKTRLASISPITSEVLRELGFPPAAEAGEYTMPGLIEIVRRQQAT